MNRFKFRVWDKQEKKYDDDHYFYIREDGTLYISNDDGDIFEAEKGRYIVEYSTGLTDKNGKEIFEGDICDLGNGWKVAIIFKDAGFGWLDYPNSIYARMISFSGHNYLSEVMGRIEIVGNIHEVKNE